MEVVLCADDAMEIARLHESGMTVQGETADRHFSPVHLALCALAQCTFGVLSALGERLGVSVTDLVVRLAWRTVERPHRIGRISLAIHWPSLPEDKLDIATRAAQTCTLNRSFSAGMEVDALVEN